MRSASWRGLTPARLGRSGSAPGGKETLDDLPPPFGTRAAMTPSCHVRQCQAADVMPRVFVIEAGRIGRFRRCVTPVRFRSSDLPRVGRRVRAALPEFFGVVRCRGSSRPSSRSRERGARSDVLDVRYRRTGTILIICAAISPTCRRSGSTWPASRGNACVRSRGRVSQPDGRW